MKIQLVRVTIIAIALMLSCFVSVCLAGDKEQVLALEVELKKIDKPVQDMSKKISTMLEKTCPEGSPQGCYARFRKSMIQSFHHGDDVSIDASNKCYDLSKRLHRVQTSKHVTEKMIDIVSKLSLKYMEISNSYSFYEDSFEALQNKNLVEHGKQLEKANEHLKIAKLHHVASLTALYELKTSLGLPVVQK